MSYNLWDLAKDVISGNVELSSLSTVKSRRSICAVCPAKNNTLNTCTACGCYIPAKIRIAKADCPLSQW